MASVATQAVGILVGIVLARTLGPAGKSVLAYAGIGLSMVLTATEGLTSAILTQYGRDKVPVALVHRALLRVVAWLGIPTALAIICVGIAIPSQRPLVGAACAVPFAIYVQGAQGILLSAGAARAMVIQGALNTVVFGLVLMPLLIFAHLPPYAALALWVAGWAASAIYACYACRRLTGEPSVFSSVDVRNATTMQLRRGLKNGGVTLAGFINLRVDVFIVSAILGARELGIYTLAITTGELLWMASQPICWSNLDRVAGSGIDEATALVVSITRKMVLLQVVLGLLFATIGPPLLTLVYGTRFAQAGPVLLYLLPGVSLYAVRMLMGYFVLVRLERPLLLMLTQTISALVCAALSIVLLPHYGLVGAAIATSVTYAVVVVIIGVIFCRATGTPPRALIIPLREDIVWLEHSLGACARTWQRTIKPLRQS